MRGKEKLNENKQRVRMKKKRRRGGKRKKTERRSLATSKDWLSCSYVLASATRGKKTAGGNTGTPAGFLFLAWQRVKKRARRPQAAER